MIVLKKIIIVMKIVRQSLFCLCAHVETREWTDYADIVKKESSASALFP